MTLLRVQVVGVVVDALTGWQDTFYFPATSADIQEHSLVYFCIWPLVAYLLVLLAMLLTVTMRSDRSFKNIWAYSETWGMPVKSSICVEKETVQLI